MLLKPVTPITIQLGHEVQDPSIACGAAGGRSSRPNPDGTDLNFVHEVTFVAVESSNSLYIARPTCGKWIQTV